MSACAFLSAALILAALPALGCPVCDTDAGAAVRAGIFNDSFSLTLLEVIAPFPVLGLVLYLLNRRLPE